MPRSVLSQVAGQTSPRRSLDGLRVVALEQAVAAPFCSRQLADLGAACHQDRTPRWRRFRARLRQGACNGRLRYFAWLNRGKRSVALDLKAPEAPEHLARGSSRAPMSSCTISPPARSSGWASDTTRSRARYPRLIWCGISGYGPTGPTRDKKAYDLLVQAETGVVGVTGTPECASQSRHLHRGYLRPGCTLIRRSWRRSSGASGRARADRIDISMLNVSPSG